MAATLAELVFKAVVVVGTPVIKSKQERARRLCMETLLPALEQIAVSRVWLEARTSALNQKDRRMVDALRGQKLVSPALRVDTARPREEPMLWASDIVAGAVNAARNGSNTRWLDALQHRITEYDIRLR
jgi:hypothetical protein